ncbi:MAG: Gfo/Idh/MocA family oxidoreductase [Caldilineaceae bacterium]|nr:Gfo/Idh/MocA family oxidoreductase [Caldilineaceae bacterium]
MADHDIKLAFIGCGSIAHRHVLAMQDLKQRGRAGFSVTAVCDANEEAAHMLAAKLGQEFGRKPAVYTDYRQLLDTERFDGADLCLPHGLHHSVTINCLEAGINVLCEKPIGVTIKAGRLMAEAADRTGRVLAIAVPHRRQPGQRAAHWVFHDSRLIGNPMTFFHHYTRPPAPKVETGPLPPKMVWRRDRMMSGGGMTLDSGFHYCDSMHYFFGDLDKVYAEMREVGSGTPRTVHERPEDSIFVTLTFKSGVVGTWAWSVAAPGKRHCSVVFHGSEGSLEDLTESPYRIFHLFERRPDQVEAGQLVRADGTSYTLAEVEQMHLDALTETEREALFPGGTSDGFAIEIWDFLEVLRGNRARPEVDGWEGLRSLAIGDAIYESAFSGNIIHVDDVLSGKVNTFQQPIDEHWGL